MLEANQRAFIYMHDSMQQSQLQVREPVGNYLIGSRDQFIGHASWLEGRSFSGEEVGADAGHKEEDGDDDSFSEEE